MSALRYLMKKRLHGCFKSVTHCQQIMSRSALCKASIFCLILTHTSVQNKTAAGQSFSNCIQQDFEGNISSSSDSRGETARVRVRVRSNESLLRVMLTTIAAKVKEATPLLDTQQELFERDAVIGQLCLYSLYRRLLPRNVQPESKVLVLIRKLQKRVPVIVLCQNIVWNLGAKSFINLPI